MRTVPYLLLWPGDLKPGNILMENTEAPYRIRVTDFGLTSAKAEPSDEQRVCQPLLAQGHPIPAPQHSVRGKASGA